MPMLDNIIMDIMDRFSNQLTDFFNLVNINDEVLKQKIDNISTNFAKLMDLDKLALKYKINSEVLQLTQSLKHQHHEQLFTTLEETLINLEEDIYPTILTLLAINLTLPVSVASAERSFASLKRLKTYLRNNKSAKTDRISIVKC
jgi:hypothetical protein